MIGATPLPPPPRPHARTTSSSPASPAEPLAERGRGLRHAVFLGHHRTSQGDPPAADRPALRLRRRALGHARRDHGLRPGRRLPQPGPALPLRPAGVVDDGAAHGRHRRGHGALRPRAAASPSSSEHQVTHAQFVPTMFVRMLKLPDEVRNGYDLSSLRSVVHAAAPCAPEVKRRMIEWWGPIIHEYYSGTEGMGMTWITSAEALTHPGSVGKAIWGEVHVVRRRRRGAPDRARTASSTSAARSGAATFEYNHDPEKTRQTLQRQGLGHAVGRRAPRRRGLPLPDRPQAVHDRLGRRQHLPAGDRGRPGPAPRRGRRRRLRRPRARNGGGGQGRGPARPGHRRRAPS